ncbi:TPA: hypothetical protein ACHSMM_004505 [Yersinia enterocolitica]
MKITPTVRTEWAISRTLSALRNIPGFSGVLRERLAAERYRVTAAIDELNRYEFYFSPGACNVLKMYRNPPYTEVMILAQNEGAALDIIRLEMRVCRSG